MKGVENFSELDFRLSRLFGLFRLCALSALAKFFLFACGAALIALRCSDDIDGDAAIVFAAAWACAM